MQEATEVNAPFPIVCIKDIHLYLPDSSYTGVRAYAKITLKIYAIEFSVDRFAVLLNRRGQAYVVPPSHVVHKPHGRSFEQTVILDPKLFGRIQAAILRQFFDQQDALKSQVAEASKQSADPPSESESRSTVQRCGGAK
jgi:hypothetical protein